MKVTLRGELYSDSWRHTDWWHRADDVTVMT